MRTENYGGPAALEWEKFGVFSPVPRARLNAQFTKKAVIFENYRHGNPALAAQDGLRSTKTQLRISACGGAFGGVLLVESENLGRLRTASDWDSPFVRQLAPHEEVSLAIPYSARLASSTNDDIRVVATIMEARTGESYAVTSTVTAVELKIEAAETFPANQNRHVFGPEETATIWQTPTNVTLVCIELFDNGGFVSNRNETVGAWLFSAPPRPEELSVTFFAAESETYSMPLSVIGPERIVGHNPRSPTPQDWMAVGRSDFASDEAGVLMVFDMEIQPLYVSFKGLLFWEGYCGTSNRTGIYCDYDSFPEDDLRHHRGNGGKEEWFSNLPVVLFGNKGSVCDRAGSWFRHVAGDGVGGYELHIPNYWTTTETRNRLPPGTMETSIQKITVLSDGTMRIEKCGLTLERTMEGIYR